MREPLYTMTRAQMGSNWRGMILAAAFAATIVGPERAALAQPEPPRFEATVLERVEPRNGFHDYSYTVSTMADDGTVYGSVSDLRRRHKVVKYRVGEGTTWLVPQDTRQFEPVPIAAGVSGVVLLYDYIFIPDYGMRRLANLHPEGFYSNDMNNDHAIAGMVNHTPNNRAAIYRLGLGFEYLPETPSSASRINDRGCVLGHVGDEGGPVDMRVWHEDGRVSEFVLPGPGRLYFNEADEACGTYYRQDSTGHTRYGGWFWSERTGLVEIPFRYLYPEGGFDVQVFGISDDGWVLGREARTDGPEFYREAFLWHVDAGFVDLADLWGWQGRFDPKQVFRGVVNGPGQLEIETFSVTRDRWMHVFLHRVKLGRTEDEPETVGHCQDRGHQSGPAGPRPARAAAL